MKCGKRGFRNNYKDFTCIAHASVYLTHAPSQQIRQESTKTVSKTREVRRPAAAADRAATAVEECDLHSMPCFRMDASLRVQDGLAHGLGAGFWPTSTSFSMATLPKLETASCTPQVEMMQPGLRHVGPRWTRISQHPGLRRRKPLSGAIPQKALDATIPAPLQASKKEQFTGVKDQKRATQVPSPSRSSPA